MGLTGMAFSIRRKSDSKPQVTAAATETATAAPPATAAPYAPPPPSASAVAADAAWRAKLTAAGPKGRFSQGEHVSGYSR
jgi:hypothetical protein